ncbi:LOW QUALITY PROTEIN: hypothetical protein Q4I29_001759 [Leishmania shawi]|uniref:Secreted protein n=1 Tax=Leishmania shawi TaxID=5680 RepID=A0ABR3ECV9_9TRYP
MRVGPRYRTTLFFSGFLYLYVYIVVCRYTRPCTHWLVASRVAPARFHEYASCVLLCTSAEAPLSHFCTISSSSALGSFLSLLLAFTPHARCAPHWVTHGL